VDACPLQQHKTNSNVNIYERLSVEDCPLQHHKTNSNVNILFKHIPNLC